MARSQRNEKRAISVVIPVRNHAPQLMQCLVALAEQTHKPAAVVVVDSHSSPALSLADLQTPGLSVDLCRARLPGSYAARNVGIEYTSTPLIAFTDADCLPESTWLERAVRFLERHIDAVAAGGPVDIFARDPCAPTAVEIYELLHAFPQQRYVEQQHFAATANFFAHRAAFKRAGLFNEKLLSGGDYEWGQRATRAGVPLKYCPDARVRHPARRTLGELARKKQRLIGGDFVARSGGQQRTIAESLKKVGRDLLPPYAEIAQLTRDERLHALGTKAKVSAVAWALHYVSAFEKARVRLGAPPKNV